MRAKVTVMQKSKDATIHIQDETGDITVGDNLVRIVYQENDTTHVTLDIADSECVLRRFGDWVTYCYFAKESAWVQIHSEEGRLDFNVDILNYEKSEHAISISYNLIQGNEVVDTFTYECSWD